MTTHDAGIIKLKYQYEITKLLAELMKSTGCKVTGISLTVEEGFGKEAAILTDVNIKLEII